MAVATKKRGKRKAAKSKSATKPAAKTKQSAPQPERKEFHLNNLFPTPILTRIWPGHEAVNMGLLRLIHEEMARNEGMKRSNVNGWHSDQDLLNWQAPEIDTLREWMVDGIRGMIKATAPHATIEGEMSLTAWANLHKRGGFNKVHTHPTHAWSGVYYVELGKDDPDMEQSGILELLDPRTGTNMVRLPGTPFVGSQPVTPEAGLMVIFPSWLPHYVTPYFGPGERVSIAFNCNLAFREEGVN